MSVLRNKRGLFFHCLPCKRSPAADGSWPVSVRLSYEGRVLPARNYLLLCLSSSLECNLRCSVRLFLGNFTHTVIVIPSLSHTVREQGRQYHPWGSQGTRQEPSRGARHLLVQEIKLVGRSTRTQDGGYADVGRYFTNEMTTSSAVA
eukprot:scaffold10821_cov199-Amphora_coffeaeformis.AAC.8